MHLVVDLIAPYAREALGDHQRVADARAAPVDGDAARPRIEVPGLDHEGVAVPAPARDAHPRLDLGRRMRPPVERHDTRLVDHLVADRHPARALHDLVAVVVDDRQDRAGDAARDAAVVEAAIEIGVGLTPVQFFAPRRLGVALCLLASLRLRGKRGHPAVGRIDDERRLVLRLAALEPVRRRGHRSADVAPGRRRGRFEIELGFVLRRLPRELLLALREFCFGEHVPGSDLRIALHRHADQVGAGPLALKVRVAPGGAGNAVGLGAGRRRSLADQCVRRQNRGEGQTSGHSNRMQGELHATPWGKRCALYIRPTEGRRSS